MKAAKRDYSYTNITLTLDTAFYGFIIACHVSGYVRL